MNRRALGYGAAVALVLLVLCPTVRDSAEIATLDEAETRIRAAGFRCASDGKYVGEHSGFLVSRVWVERDEICVLRKTGTFDREKWAGKIWIAKIGGTVTLGFDENLAGYDLRVWGCVMAFGDKELLNEVETALAPRFLF